MLFKEFCRIRRGASPRPIEEHISNGGIPWIKISDVSNGGKYINETKEFIKESSKKHSVEVQKGDLIVTNSGSPGIPKISNIYGCIHDGWLILDNFKTFVSKEYIYYWLMVNKNNLVKKGNGSIFINLKKEILENFEIDLPDRKTQDKIVEILSNIDNQIERNNCMVKRLQDLATSTYSRWFNQFEFPNEDGLPYKSNNGEFVYNEELKKNIPVNWEVKKLGDILKESDKSQIQVGEAKQNIGTYPFFTSGEEIVLYKDYFVSGAYCYLNTGGNADVKFFDGKASYSTDTWCTSFNEYTYIMNEYLQSIKPLMDKLFFSGSGLKHLQKEAFKKQKVLIPSEDIVFKYNDIVNDCHKQVSKIYMQNIELNNLKSKLLPLLINGQLEV